MASQDESMMNDPELAEEIIRITEKREREYDEYTKKIDGLKRSKTTPITSYFPLLPQINITNTSRVYVAKFIRNEPLPPCPNKGKNILIHTSNKYLGGSLSPYHLKDENGCLLENVWQFSKVYWTVYAQKTALSSYDPDNIIWEHPAEIHIDPTSRKPTKEYWEWRKKGTHNAKAVRYPNGFHGRNECAYALWPADKCTIGEETDIVDPDGVKYKKLTYIEARKVIYCGEYARLVHLTDCFKKIQQMISEGQTIQIIEVDGPNIDWYKKSPISGGIKDKSLAMKKSVIDYLLNDPTHPFGHGYTIAALLLGGASWICA